ncbi:MAG: TVP38/TMEM64 family protein [Syntrophorhabdaceae bacterium]|nr:TVP38/TMEM64 family protein [Syntrophorhabdaceae bacterium]
MERKSFIWIKLLLFLLFVIGLAALSYRMGWISFFFDRERLIDFIASLGVWGFAGFIILQVAQVIAAPIPGEITGFIGGYLYGSVIGTILSTIGLTIGSIIAFQISRFFGRPVVEHMVDPKVIRRFDFLLHQKGAFLVFLLFLLPGFPKDYLCYVLGLGRLSLLEFTAISATGRLLGTTMLAFGGSFLRQEKYVEFSLLSVAAVGVVVLALFYRERLERWFKVLHERKQNT